MRGLTLNPLGAVLAFIALIGAGLSGCVYEKAACGLDATDPCNYGSIGLVNRSDGPVTFEAGHAARSAAVTVQAGESYRATPGDSKVDLLTGDRNRITFTRPGHPAACADVEFHNSRTAVFTITRGGKLVEPTTSGVTVHPADCRSAPPKRPKQTWWATALGIASIPLATALVLSPFALVAFLYVRLTRPRARSSHTR